MFEGITPVNQSASLPQEKDKEKGGSKTLEEVRQEERNKLYPRLEELKGKNDELSGLLKTQRQQLDELLDEKKKRDDGIKKVEEEATKKRKEEEEKKLKEAKEKDEAITVLFGKQEELINAQNERLALMEKGYKDKVGEIEGQLHKENIEKERTALIAASEREGKPVIEDLVVGNTVEELKSNIEVARKAYEKMKSNIIQKERLVPKELGLPSGESHESFDLPVEDNVRKFAYAPRFSGDKDFNTRVNAMRNKESELMKEIAQRKEIIISALRKRGM